MILTYVKIITYFVEFKFIRLTARIRGLPLNPLPNYDKAQKGIINNASKDLLSDWSKSSLSYKTSQIDLVKHLKGLWFTFRDLSSFLKRKSAQNSHDFSADINLDHYPSYLRRNYHYQSDGYFSKKSALIYDHQIELLFLGTAHLMRRVGFDFLRSYLNSASFKVLEFGAGSGTSAMQFKEVYPLCTLDLLDPSNEYLDYAFDTYPKAFNEKIPIALENFCESHNLYDVIFSCFTMHEIPSDFWKACLDNTHKALKPGGLLLLIDSQQDHDSEKIHFALDDFQNDYYEPYFDDYRVTPLEEFIPSLGFKLVAKKNVLLSKALVFQKV